MALTKIKLNTMVTGTLPDANIPDDITIDTAAAVPASGLTGNTLASGVTASSLTSVGTLTSLTVSGSSVPQLTIGGTTPTIYLGDSGAEDTKLVFRGNATDVYLALDDSADKLLIGQGTTVGGDTRITIDPTNGNTTFAGDLTISNSIPLIYMNDTSGADNNQIIFQAGGSNIFRIGTDITTNNGTSNFEMTNGDGNASRLTIDSSGNSTFAGNIVGKTNSHISYSSGQATTTATGGALNVPGSDIVTGRLFLQGYQNGATDLIGFNNETDQLVLYNYTDNAYIMKFAHNKNVEFMGGTITFPVGGIIRFGERGNLTHNSSNYDMTFNTNSLSNALVIKGTGSIGIGDTDPDALLSIKGNSDANTTPSIRLKDGSDTREAWISNTAGDLVLANGGNDNVPHCKIQMYDGNLMTLSTSNTERIRLLSERKIAMFNTSIPQDFGGERGHLLISSVDNASANNYAVLQLQGHSMANNVAIGAIHFYDHGISNASIQANRQNNSGSAKLMFSTSESGGNKKTRMTIYDAGSVLIDNDTSGSPAQLTVQNDGSTGWLGTWLVLNSKNNSNRGAGVTMHNQAADKGFFTGCRYQSAFNRWSICFEGRNYADQSTADSDHEILHVNYDGAAYNDQNTWGSSSDKRIKNSIVDSNSQWDDIKALKIKNYKLTKHGEDAPTLIGVIAQDLEESGMNGLVDETEADELQIARYEDINEGDKIKSVKYSVLYMKAIKALQEAMEKIETLETKVEALENA